MPNATRQIIDTEKKTPDLFPTMLVPGESIIQLQKLGITIDGERVEPNRRVPASRFCDLTVA